MTVYDSVASSKLIGCIAKSKFVRILEFIRYTMLPRNYLYILLLTCLGFAFGCNPKPPQTGSMADCADSSQSLSKGQWRKQLNSAQNLTESRSQTYLQIVNELEYRFAFKARFDESLQDSSDTNLILAKAVLDYENFSGKTISENRLLADTIDDNKSLTLVEYLQLVYEERRQTIEDLQKKGSNVKYQQIALDIAPNTVAVIPQIAAYGNPPGRLGTFTAWRRNIRDWLSGGCCPNCHLSNYSTFAESIPKIRSGTLIKGGYVLTAGHNMKTGETYTIIANYVGSESPSSIRFPNNQIAEGKVVYVEFNNAHSPDFALLKLISGFGDAGYDLDKEINDTLLKGDSLFFAGHQLGQKMIGDPKGTVIDWPAPSFKENYIFADLQVYSGTSGAPVVHYFFDSLGILHKDWIGIVVGSGGLDDFIPIDYHHNFSWNPRPKSNAVGARILRVNSALKSKLKSIIAHPNDKPPHKKTEMTYYRKRKKSIDLTKYYVLVIGQYLNLKDKVTQKIQNLVNLRYPTTILMCGDSIHIWAQTRIDSVYDIIILRRLPIHQEVWPLDIMIPGKSQHHLEFKHQVYKNVLEGTPLPNNTTYNILDGIGLSDVVDELPDLRKYNRHFMWLCDCEYIELQAINMEYENGQKPAISIKTVKPFVPIYTRTEEIEK